MIAYAFQQGLSPESIVQSFPLLTLEQVYGAIAILREIGFRAGEAEAFRNLAQLHQILGELAVANQYCQQALSLATELGIPLAAECEALQLNIENEKLKMEETQA